LSNASWNLLLPEASVFAALAICNYFIKFTKYPSKIQKKNAPDVDTTGL
jgi:hypothetical protein